MLEYVADGFIASAIGKISGYLKLTEAMAGATLLAFSNGATDVITAIVATGNSDSDDLAVGALFGASTFAITIILTVVIYAMPGKLIPDLQRGNLVRDIITYIIATGFFMISGFYQMSYLIIALVLIAIYLIYVLIVWLEERKKVPTIAKTKHILDENTVKTKTNLTGLTEPLHEEIDDDEGEEKSISKISVENEEIEHLESTAGRNNNFKILLSKPSTEAMNEMLLGGDHDKNHLGVPGGHQEPIKFDGEKEENIGAGEHEEEDIKRRIKKSSILLEGSILSVDHGRYESKIGRAFLKSKKMIIHSWKDSNLFERICYVIEAPIRFIARFTVAPVDEPLLHPHQDLIYPITSPLWVAFTEGALLNDFNIGPVKLQIWSFLLITGFIISGILLFTVKKRDWKARPRWFFLILTIGAGVKWLEFLVQLMVDMLNFLQGLTGFSDIFMGMTILGMSNSCVDMFVDRAMALQGLEIMAVTGIFAGQMFNFLVGFGISSLVRYLGNTSNPPKFHLYDWSNLTGDRNFAMTFTIIAFLALVLAFTLIRLPILKYSFGKGTALLNLVLYGVVFVVMLVIELKFD